jgi:hypothetical protein
MLFRPMIGHQCVMVFLASINMSNFIKGSIIASLNLHFEFGFHHQFIKIIIELIGSSSLICENRPLVNH